ncbi:MAG: NifB/NifX family molybdenum-iron cluster-binding protein [Methanobacterium sp.]|nr:NifB/NifX family molybdenum-iron cluster-binding protein [Methanobacterium sp.]
MKVAVSVSDDKKFTEHFGRAQKFLIYEFNGEEAEFKDSRESEKVAGEKHQWGKSLNVVRDCDVIICLQIGMSAKAGLKSDGKKIVEDEGSVEEVLNKFIKHEQFLKKPLNF